MVCERGVFQEKYEGVFCLHPVIPDSVHPEPGLLHSVILDNEMGHERDMVKVGQMGHERDISFECFMGHERDTESKTIMGYERDIEILYCMGHEGDMNESLQNGI